MKFHREAFLAILDRSNYGSRAHFAAAVGISPGALHDICSGRRNPSTALMRRFVAELKVPISAILTEPVAATA